ncbi:polysaccharide pyruvyl transferase family protein [Acidaminobacter sp. JC074]|uniref:polysaccharide pyruvyl transferase family protein n=1 Tax=Acidaminobacter sp. JC074 TaxID=2530199 RepID=UPI001F1035AB|nr:polysaccharide pyruvyl transferase family protein [Acidaminobacter sp. JC074]
MNKYKILHIASFHGNIGDNANHSGFRNLLKKLIEDELEFTELEIREFYKSWNLRSFNTSQFTDLCNAHDLVIIGGGNFFELQWEYSHTGTTIDISEETLLQIKTPILFNALGCDYAKGTTNNSIKKFENFMKILSESDQFFVSLRNDGSQKNIEALYDDMFPNIHYIPDAGMYLTTDKNFESYKLYKDNLIGINIVTDMKELRFPNTNWTYDQFIKEFAKIMNNFLIENPKNNLVLFPHIYSDLEAINDFLKHIDDKFRRTRISVAPYLSGPGSEEYIFGLYKKCDLILGMRFHSNVCSIGQAIPSIGLNSYEKVENLYTTLSLENRLIKVNDPLEIVELSRFINQSIENSEEIASLYKKRTTRFESDHRDYYTSLQSWLHQNLK